MIKTHLSLILSFFSLASHHASTHAALDPAQAYAQQNALIEQNTVIIANAHPEISVESMHISCSSKEDKYEGDGIILYGSFQPALENFEERGPKTTSISKWKGKNEKKLKSGYIVLGYQGEEAKDLYAKVSPHKFTPKEVLCKSFHYVRGGNKKNDHTRYYITKLITHNQLTSWYVSQGKKVEHKAIGTTLKEFFDAENQKKDDDKKRTFYLDAKNRNHAFKLKYKHFDQDLDLYLFWKSLND